MTALFFFTIPTLANLLAAGDITINMDYMMSYNTTSATVEMRMVESTVDGEIAPWNLFASVYFFYGIYWTFEVIHGLSIMTIAGAITKWYWRKGGKIKLSGFPTKSSLYRALRFHIGTACFGGAIVVVVQTIQWAWEYIHARFALNKSRIIQTFLCCISCIVHCCVAIVKEMSYAAYIVTAMRGRAFCFSAARVWYVMYDVWCMVSCAWCMVHSVYGVLYIYSVVYCIQYVTLPHRTAVYCDVPPCC
jgi:hypothetical protein